MKVILPLGRQLSAYARDAMMNQIDNKDHDCATINNLTQKKNLLTLIPQ